MRVELDSVCILDSFNMDGSGANMCKAVEIEGVAVKATFCSRVCVGGTNFALTWFYKMVIFFAAVRCSKTRRIAARKYLTSL